MGATSIHGSDGRDHGVIYSGRDVRDVRDRDGRERDGRLSVVVLHGMIKARDQSSFAGLVAASQVPRPPRRPHGRLADIV